MSASIVKRLLWKEYRVQRGLWLALLLIAVGMQVLVFFIISSPPNRGPHLLGTLIGLGMLPAGFFALGCGCVTFASEREDDTHIRAVSMVYPPALTLLLKMLFGIVTTLAFVTLVLLSAWLLRGSELALTPETLTPAILDECLMMTVWVTCLMLTAQSWGVCCSLLTKRVLTAMFAAAVATSVTYTLAINLAAFMPRYSPSEYSQNRDYVVLPFIAIITAVGLAGLFVVNLLLTRRWLNRDFADGPRVSRRWLWFIPRVRFVRISDDGTLVIPISPEQDDYLPVLSPEVAAIQPPPNSIRRWLGLMSLGRGRKTFGFLVWREWVETRRTFWLGIVLLIVFQFVTRSRDGQFDPIQLSGTAIMLALACGFMTFRQEQTDNQHRFLTFRGTSASQLWLSKHVVWMSRLVVGCVVLFASWMQIRSTGGGYQFSGHSLLDEFTRTGFSGVSRAAIALLTFYATGQTASLFIRKGIVSAFVTMLAGVVVGSWIGLTASLVVPLWLSALPLALGLLFGTLLRCRPWMMERNSLGTWYRPALVCIASVAACLSLTCLFRATEIPDVGPITNRPRLVGSFFDPTLPATATEQDVADLLKPLTDAEKETAKIYTNALELLRRNGGGIFGGDGTRLHFKMGEPLHRHDRDWAIENSEILALVLQAAARPSCAFWHPSQYASLKSPIEARNGDYNPGIQQLVQLTLIEARRKFEDGQPDVALDHQVAALALCRHLEARGTYPGTSHSRAYARMVLDSLRQWASHDAVTKPRLDRAASELRRHRSLMLSPEARNVAHHLALRNELEHDFEGFVESLLDRSIGDPNEKFRARLVMNLPGERERFRRIINFHEHHLSLEYAALVRQLAAPRTENQPFVFTSNLLTYVPDQRQWPPGLVIPELSISPLRFPHFDQVNGSILEDFTFEIEFRATLLTLHLLAEHRGRELPESLDSPAIRELGLVDPWSGRGFVLFADGLPKETEFIGSQGVVVSDGGLDQPFFITHGQSPVEYRLVRRPVFLEGMPGMSVGGGAAPGLPEAIEAKPPLAPEETELYVETRDLTPNAQWQTARFPESAIYRLPKGAFRPHGVPAWTKLMPQ